MIFQVSSRFGVETIEANSWMALIKICDRKYQDNWDAEPQSIEMENNQRYADLIVEHDYYE
jgi:hypothetical protein